MNRRKKKIVFFFLWVCAPQSVAKQSRPNVYRNLFIQIFTNLSHYFGPLVHMAIERIWCVCALLLFFLTLTMCDVRGSSIAYICNAFINIQRPTRDTTVYNTQLLFLKSLTLQVVYSDAMNTVCCVAFV